MILFTRDQKIKIVCEQINGGFSVKEICEKHKIPESTFFYWKKSFFEDTEGETYEERNRLESIKPRVVLMGINKSYFLRDCYVRGWSDSKMLKNIIDVYYSVMNNRPDMAGKEMTEIKKMITDRIKFK